MSRRVLVLGGTGFLGAAIAERFRAAGDLVTTVSRTRIGERAGHERLDLGRAGADRLARLLAGHRPQVVVNAAGTVWGGSGRQMTELNAEFTERLVTAVSLYPGRPRLIQLGSAHEYGPIPSGTSVTEETPPAPVSEYGRSKLRGTEAVLRGANTTTLDGTVLRVANAAGPGIPRDSLLGAVAHSLAEPTPGSEAPVPIHLTALTASRDFVDVRDVADAVLATAGAGGVTGRIVNIARGEAVPVRDLVHRLIELSGVRAEVIEARPGTSLRAGHGWQRLDVRRARDLLGWRPARHLDESLTALLAAVQPRYREGAPR